MSGQNLICMKCPKCGYAGDANTGSCPSDGQQLVPVYTDPWLGASLANRYNIIEAAGAGGWGTVYLAEQISLGRKVAVKILDRKLLENDSQTKRFEQEARTLSTLQHPGIVSVIDFGMMPQPYIVMEWVSGQDLSEFLKSSKLTRQDQLHIAKQLAEALQHAHSLHIVHRDLKPSNIKIFRTQQRELRVKILDFGLAKVFQSTESPLTLTGECFGSPQYMSPEQCMGRQLTPASDIYALGCVLYEIVAGRPPFNKETFGEYYAAHNTEKPGAIFANPSAQDKALEALIIKCLAKDASDRYPNSNDLLSALNSIASGSEPASASQSPEQRTPLVLVSIIAVAAIAGGLLWTQPWSQKGSQGAPVVSTQPEPADIAPETANMTDTTTASTTDTPAAVNTGSSITDTPTATNTASSTTDAPVTARTSPTTTAILAKPQSTKPLNKVEKIASKPRTPEVIKEKLAEASAKPVPQSSPKPSLTQPEKAQSVAEIRDVVWNDTIRAKEIKLRLYKPALTPNFHRPVIFWVGSENAIAEQDWLLRSWCEVGGFYVVAYDPTNVPMIARGSTPQESAKIHRERHRDARFVVTMIKDLIEKKDPLFSSAQAKIGIATARPSGQTGYSLLGIMPSGSYWDNEAPMPYVPFGFLVISGNGFGAKSSVVFKEIKAPLMAVSFGEDLGTGRWDPQIKASTPYAYATSKERFQIFFPGVSMQSFAAVNESLSPEQKTFEQLSLSFWRAASGNSTELKYLHSDSPEVLLGSCGKYCFYEQGNEDERP